MIFGSLTMLKDLGTISKVLTSVIQRIRDINPTSAVPGRYEIIGTNCYYTLSLNKQKKDNSVFEIHRHYVDLQYIVSGDEDIKWADVTKLHARGDYDELNDCLLLEGEAQNVLHLQQGDWAVFFPGDAHAPCIMQTTSFCLKLVAKIPVSVFDI